MSLLEPAAKKYCTAGKKNPKTFTTLSFRVAQNMLDKQSSPLFVLRCLVGCLETVQCSSADSRRFGGGVHLHSLITSASAMQGVQTIVSQWVGESFTELNMTYNQVNVGRWTLAVHFYGYCIETIIKFVQG